MPSAYPLLARTWLLAHLIAAVLTDARTNEFADFSPRHVAATGMPRTLWRV
jgi:hypothetical protein